VSNRPPFSGPMVVLRLEAETRGRVWEIRDVRSPLLTARQVAERPGVCTATVYGLIEGGVLTHIRVSNAIRVAPIDLSAYIAMEKSAAKRRRQRAPRSAVGR